MDRIFIENLELYAYYGANAEEKTLGQRFLVSLQLDMDLRAAGKTDDLSQTVNYGKLIRRIETDFSNKAYNLIEAVAEEICEMILLNYPPVQKVKLRLTKPWAPVRRHVDYVAVELERQWYLSYVRISSPADSITAIVDEINKLRDCVVATYSSTQPHNVLDETYITLNMKTLETLEELEDSLSTLETTFKTSYDKSVSFTVISHKASDSEEMKTH